MQWWTIAIVLQDHTELVEPFAASHNRWQSIKPEAQLVLHSDDLPIHNS